MDKASDNTFGVAAISLNCAFNAGDKVFTGDVGALGEALEEQMGKHDPYFATVADPRISCALFHIATPGVVGEEVDCIRASSTFAREMTPSLGSRVFEELAHDLHSTPKRPGSTAAAETMFSDSRCT